MKLVWQCVIPELAKPGKGSVYSRKAKSKKLIRKSICGKSKDIKLLADDYLIKIDLVGNFEPSSSYSGTYDLDDVIETVVGALSKFIIPDDKYIVKIEAQKVKDKSRRPGEGHTYIQIFSLSS